MASFSSMMERTSSARSAQRAAEALPPPLWPAPTTQSRGASALPTTSWKCLEPLGRARPARMTPSPRQAQWALLAASVRQTPGCPAPTPPPARNAQSAPSLTRIRMSARTASAQQTHSWARTLKATMNAPHAPTSARPSELGLILVSRVPPPPAPSPPAPPPSHTNAADPPSPELHATQCAARDPMAAAATLLTAIKPCSLTCGRPAKSAPLAAGALAVGDCYCPDGNWGVTDGSTCKNCPADSTSVKGGYLLASSGWCDAHAAALLSAAQRHCTVDGDLCAGRPNAPPPPRPLPPRSQAKTLPWQAARAPSLGST